MILTANEEDVITVRSYLSDLDVELTEWNNSGVGWISRWQQSKPTLLFVDHVMPLRAGMYCLLRVKGLAKNAFVIYMHSFTGFMANDVEAKALKNKADAVIQKPFCRKRFKLMIERILLSDWDLPKL